MAEQQRKIELQSPDDLQYLVANVKRAAREMIDRDLPPIEGEDAMRRLVEEIVGEVSLGKGKSARDSRGGIGGADCGAEEECSGGGGEEGEFVEEGA
ncbi:predicted protein [Sclerotinia sclerotiorum 1980 UF-70]|uniref:Uncharacterized protein n=1 Tax=Sclerotinia sclerotiorum (strain ATCC 18683 / 1980 / Ss-1) TaxID=665079 RepID=A7F3F4_SCLS1|nr:predicted protein [Sclerotinia sclerotiorum 1980 UF-70]EDN97275.1 predicted protein [Sclerotinia sclerotiorum 1980 UF-70]